MINPKQLSLQEYSELIRQAKSHFVYQTYLEKMNEVAPNFFILILEEKLDNKFPERFEEMSKVGNNALENFAFGLIDEKEYENKLMSLIPKISEVYQLHTRSKNSHGE
jgi:hypothetical protein